MSFSFVSLRLGLSKSCWINKYFKSKRQYFFLHKCFLFHFKSPFRSLEIQILEFNNLKFHEAMKCLGINKEHILLNNLGSKQSGNETWPVM